MTSPDFAPSRKTPRRLALTAANCALALTLVTGCGESSELQSTDKQASPKMVTLPAGTVLLVEPKPDADICAVLTKPTEGKIFWRDHHYVPAGQGEYSFAGFSADDLGVCPKDPDGKVWQYEGETYVPPVAPPLAPR